MASGQWSGLIYKKDLIRDWMSLLGSPAVWAGTLRRPGERTSVLRVILVNVKVRKRGQVTIPKGIRDRFGMGPDTEVEFSVERGQIILRKRAAELPLRGWKGFCGPAFKEAGYRSVDEYVDEVRGKL